MFCFEHNKMNDISNTFLFAGDKFMPEMHLKLVLPIVLVGHLKNRKVKKE